MEEKIINGFVKLLFNRIEQYSEFILPNAQPNSSNLSEYLNNNRAYGAVECQVQDRKECLIEVFTCGYQTYFSCKGAFSCGSSELFTCSGEQQRSGSQDSFDCTAVFDQHFECSYAQEPFVCDSEMFRCSRASQGEIESFDCKAGDSYDFDCTNSGTFDFECSPVSGEFTCSSEITEGFQCSANHWFMCNNVFLCVQSHNCSPQGGQCSGDWCANTASYKGDDGKPSDFNCYMRFDCGQNGGSASGGFNCTAQSQFICTGDMTKLFTCHNDFTCAPTDGAGYPDASFTCIDGAFECDDYTCSQRFNCYDDFKCDDDFDCDNQSFKCTRKRECTSEALGEVNLALVSYFACDDFTCTGGFSCSEDFGGCIPSNDFDCIANVNGGFNL